MLHKNIYYLILKNLKRKLQKVLPVHTFFLEKLLLDTYEILTKLYSTQ